MSIEADYRRIETLVLALRDDPERLPFPSAGVTLVETHISWVLLCGEDVLKFKKPVSMGFIDFSTAERRVHCAEEEIRLNGRLAPELYLGLVTFGGDAAAPQADGEPALATAVHMRQFDPAGQLDRLVAADALGVAEIEETGRIIAAFQADAPLPGAGDDWGTPDEVMAPVHENHRRIREAAADCERVLARLEGLARIGETWGAELTAAFEARRRGGFVREGHGDLHLGNIARTPWGIRAFDCLEFAPALRWLDVTSDLAFLFMDLAARDHAGLAWRLLNVWLEETGDHGGVRLLRFYTLYRTLVRVKVAALRRTQQERGDERDRLEAEMHHYLALAERVTAPPRPALILMHGVSGSGKSRIARRLGDALGAIQLRSDVERKRLLGGTGRALYDAAATRETFDELAARTTELLAGGHRVIVDATFLDDRTRARFVGLAGETVPTAIVACDATPAVLRDRVARRLAERSDPSDATVEVLEKQLSARIPVADHEARRVLHLATDGDAVDGRTTLAIAELARLLGSDPLREA